MTHDRGSGPYRDGEPVTAESLWQEIKNESWPLRDKAGKAHANGIDDQPAENQRECLVRLEFKTDGDVVLPGRAQRWTATHVYVVVNDPRVRRMAVWVRAQDVRRPE